MGDLAHVLKEVRPSWRGGALLRWQPLIHRGGALPFSLSLIDTWWLDLEKWRPYSPHLAALASPLGAPSLRRPCALLPINKELLPLIC